MRARPIHVAMLLAACGTSETAAGTEVLNVPLASFASPSAEVRARLVAGEPATETARQTCKEAVFEIAFARKRDPQTSALYLDSLTVRVVAANGAVVTARGLHPENSGSAERVEMGLPVIVSVDRGGSGGQCSYLVRAGSPAITPL